ncbi:hypothetical protein HU200_040332 [Digitaria exilis]|uniref:Reverse transcriptase zinc-binding domain-containing protein n=1 Tax=Digitaria exilis TaxID=1010633 RepID=A0A835BGP4_9POAL|nr:hypothetical protein HU200_040332 [Digitaria exilis]
MFRHSIDITIGDGQLALFWSDRWNGSDSPCVAAPDLCKLVMASTKKKRSVAQALPQKTWISDIKGRLTVPALVQYIFLWHSLGRCQLRTGMEDVIQWRWTTTGTYSARSAYRAFFEGSTRFVMAKPLWKCWAPLKVKFTLWLAIHGRLWTSDRRHRHGLQESPACSFCAQEPETCDHLFHHCCFTRTIWFQVSRITNIPEFTRPDDSLVGWWLHSRRGRTKELCKGIDSTVLLVSCYGRGVMHVYSEQPRRMSPMS